MAKVKDKLQYVFIHPSWRGAWCWDQVLSVMRAWGREAYAPDGPGHGSRLHEIERVSLADYPWVYSEFIQRAIRHFCTIVVVKWVWRWQHFVERNTGPISEARANREVRDVRIPN